MKPNSEHEIPEFLLKRFFQEEAGRSPRRSLSSSYCEPLSVKELLDLEPAARHEWEILHLGYPEMHGSSVLRELIARGYRGLSAHQIVLFNGADDALSVVFLSLLEPGDQIIVQAPNYQSLEAVAQWRGCEVRRWLVREEEGWLFDVGDLKALVSPATKMIVVNTPHNPTGSMMEEQEYLHLLQLAEQHGILAVSDEVYEGLELDPDVRRVKAAECSPNALSVSGLSKSFGLPGLRVAWIATTNPSFLRQASRLSMYINTYLSKPSECLAGIALRNRNIILERNRQLAQTNRKLVEDFLQRHSDRMEWIPPRAGVVAFPRIMAPQSAEAFCTDLLSQTGILLAPSPLFQYGDQHVRLVKP